MDFGACPVLVFKLYMIKKSCTSWCREVYDSMDARSVESGEGFLIGKLLEWGQFVVFYVPNLF